MNEVLKVEGISKKFENELFSNLSFTFYEGSVNGILCSGNSGKTTLIKTITGIVYADKGQILIDGIAVKKSNLSKFVPRISIILDDINEQFICNKVLDEIRYPLENLKCSDKSIDDAIEKITNIIDLKLILGKDISRLTYFEKVKTLLAASIIHMPKILFIDDIFKLLTDKEKKEIRKFLTKINKTYNMTIVITSSDLEDVLDCTNILVLKEGNIIIKGGLDKVVEQDNELAKLGISVPIMIDLSMKLRFYDLVDKIYYDEDKVVDALWN